MSQNNNILQELQELESSLASQAIQNTYTVPAGYFEGFASQVLGRVKALEAKNAVEELGYLSPVLNAISRQSPYEVPAGYFQGIEERLMQVMHEKNNYTVKDELESLSPLLASLNKKMPYAVPEGYFENLSAVNKKPAAKVVTLTHRKWFKYAAAAMITGIVVLAGFLVFRKDENPSETKIFASFTKEVKKMNETEKDNLIDFMDAGMNGKETAQVNPDPKLKNVKDVKELLQDVSDQELKDFNEQTEDVEDVLLTN